MSEDASIGVSNLYNGVTKEYSNVLAFETVAGTNDKMSIVRPSGNSDASAVVFEADLMLDVGYDGFVYQVFFADGENGRNAYLIQLEQRNGKVKITDNSNSNTNAEGAVNHTLIDGLEHKEWFKLRVEFYKATVGDDIRIKIFVNNALVSISNNHYGYGQSAPCTEIKSVSFYSFQSNTGMLYFDNVKLFDLNATCDEDLFN